MDESTPTRGPVSGTAGEDRMDRDDRGDRGDDRPGGTSDGDAATRDGSPDDNGRSVPDTATGDGHDETTVDPDLLARAEALADLPLAERADAFDRLNSDVQAALRGIEAT